ncbi:hypothetical protein Nepgr_023164 [Nepenthes gracilis]|uniref:Uncharacterized protein n=1 Tax=Nepenthes gracilis TaxID=150966 RepID=A0AAD3T231_NEPGR|nr:hypothetical protein Nepgr_023164 [Nepenthes gracilis]
MVVDVVVDYQWRPGHKVNGRSTTQKSSNKVTLAHQDVAPLNLTPDYSSEGKGPFSYMEGLNAVDNPQCVNLGNVESFSLELEASDAKHKVPMERALPPELAKEGPVDKSSKNSAVQQAGAIDCKAVIRPGVAGELKDIVQRPELLLCVIAHWHCCIAVGPGVEDAPGVLAGCGSVVVFSLQECDAAVGSYCWEMGLCL